MPEVEFRCERALQNLLVESDQKDRTFGSLGVAGNLFGAFTIVILDADSHPPVADWTAETLHLGALVAMRYMISQLIGGVLFLKSADLHRPSSARFQRRRCAQHPDAHPGHPRLQEVHFFG